MLSSPRMAYIYNVLLIFLASFVGFSLGQCTFPTNLRGAWLSSEKGDLQFADQSLSGFYVSNFNFDNFTCIEQYSGKYVVKSESFRRFGLTFYAYICLDIQEVTAVQSGNLFYYYRASDQQADAENERVLFKLATFPQATGSEVCTVTDYTTSGVRYSVLMKNDSIDTVKNECPIPFLGNFNYTYDTGSGNLCNESLLTVCDDKITMSWNYSLCSQIQAYSAGGVTSCIYSSSVNDLYTVHVYNEDLTTDQSTTYRFTCYQAKGYGTVYVTQHPGDCPAEMNETYVPSPGASLVMTSELLCAYDTTTTTTTTTTTAAPKPKESLSAGVIAAIVIICLLIIIVIIVIIVYHLYNKRKKRRQAEWEAANRKVDPDALSPNMRLGLPDETRYDLDRLMYSPDNMKNNLIKRSQRKDMVDLEGLEGYNEGQIYMDEEQRQTALDAQLYAEKRKRRDNKDEFKAAENTNKVYSNRIKELAKGRKRPMRAMALAKLKFRPKAKPKADTPDGSADGRATKTKDIVIQVEEADKHQTPAESKRKTRFADESEAKTEEAVDKPDAKKAKKLEDVETLSDIADNENAVDDLSDDETKEPRLILPKLKPDKKERRKPPKDRFSLGSNPRTPAMPHNTRFIPPKPKQRPEEQEFTEPLTKPNPNFANMTPLARIHRRDNPRAWKDAFGDNTNGMESMDIETMKKRLPENRWKKLLEELYRDKKYFDYMKNTTSTSEKDLMTSADETLQFLYGRALFWELQQPIPARPPSHVKRMFSRYEPPKSSNIQRSSTTMSRNSIKRVPRTPSTQVSRLKKRENLEKKKPKNNENTLPVPEFFEGGTQTDFSPIPMTPVMISDINDLGSVDHISLQGSATDERILTPVIPFNKEVTKSDIKLEEFNDNNIYDEEDPNFVYQPFQEEEVTVAI